MTGKEKCKMLKQIRAQIAAQNDVELVTRECTYKGECKGTCPRCESEVRYLEAQLEKRRAACKKVAIAGISAGLALSLSGCSVSDVLLETPDTLRSRLHPDPVIEVLDGEVAMTDDGLMSALPGSGS